MAQGCRLPPTPVMKGKYEKCHEICTVDLRSHTGEYRVQIWIQTFSHVIMGNCVEYSNFDNLYIYTVHPACSIISEERERERKREKEREREIQGFALCFVSQLIQYYLPSGFMCVHTYPYGISAQDTIPSICIVCQDTYAIHNQEQLRVFLMLHSVMPSFPCARCIDRMVCSVCRTLCTHWSMQHPQILATGAIRAPTYAKRTDCRRRSNHTAAAGS